VATQVAHDDDGGGVAAGVAVCAVSAERVRIRNGRKYKQSADSKSEKDRVK
jgi:hypothetical protein